MSFRARLRPLKRASAGMLERCWGAMFSVLGKVAPPGAAEWASPGGQRVLVLAPHPDDEVIGCGGTVLRHVAAGDHVTIAIATDGRRAGGMRDPVGMSARRHAEALRAYAELRAERFEWLGLPEGDWDVARLREAMARLLTELRPDIVYASSRVDFHPEHHKVAHGLALALDAVAQSHRPVVRVYQIQVPLTATLVNLVSDIEMVQASSETALRAYESQAGTIAGIYRQKRYGALRHGLSTAAEEFWQLPSERYSALHQAPPESWRDHYRGYRQFPLTDPLAWMVGAGWRRRLVREDQPGDR